MDVMADYLPTHFSTLNMQEEYSQVSLILTLPKMDNATKGLPLQLDMSDMEVPT